MLMMSLRSTYLDNKQYWKKNTSNRNNPFYFYDSKVSKVKILEIPSKINILKFEFIFIKFLMETNITKINFLHLTKLLFMKRYVICTSAKKFQVETTTIVRRSQQESSRIMSCDS